MSVTFVTRAEWGARPPTVPAPRIQSLVTTAHWEGPSVWGGTIGDHASCATKVRAIQAYHMDHNGWADIAYNGVACPHGYVFEGRGPQRRSAANGTNYSNSVSTVICYLGGQDDPFTDDGRSAMISGAAWLGQLLRKGHRDWYDTQCPGDVIYAWIQAGAHGPTPPPDPGEQDIMRGTYVRRIGTGPVYLLLSSGEHVHVTNYATCEDVYVTELGVQIVVPPVTVPVPDAGGAVRHVWDLQPPDADMVGIP